MFPRALAIVAVMLLTDVVSAQQPAPLPLQQRARQLAGPVRAPANSASQLAQRAAEAAAAAQAEELPEPEIAPPRPSLMSPSLGPSPSAPGLVKAPGATIKAPTGPTFDPSAPGQRPIPPAPRYTPSAMQAGPGKKAPSSGTAPSTKTPHPLDETTPQTPPGDPFGDTPRGGRPPVIVPPGERAQQPADAPPDPVVPPAEAPVEAMPETAPAETPPRAEPPATEPPFTDPLPPASPRNVAPPMTEPLPAPRGGNAPPRQNGAPRATPRTTPGAPLPGARAPGSSGPSTAAPQPVPEHGDYIVDGDSGGMFSNLTSVMPSRAPFNGYYDRSCPPDVCFDECAKCRLPGGSWATFDVLMWWTQGMPIPALVTTGPQRFGGVLNAPTTSILFGNTLVDNDVRAGGRLNIGTWIDSERTIGFGGAFFDLQRAATNYNAGSNGDPLLARPFFDTTTQSAETQVVARAGIASGNIYARTNSDLLGADAYMRMAVKRGNGRMLDFVHGYRYLQINDSINVYDKLVSTDQSGAIPLGTTISGQDQFTAKNQFQGWQFGLLGEQVSGRFTFAGGAKIGIGNIHQVVQIAGRNTVQVPGADSVTRAGSLLTQPSNIGRYANDAFGFVPEVNFNLGYQVTQRLRVNLGYTFLWINRVAESGRQINTSIDENQLFGLPGNQPTFHFKESGFWAQGMNLGFDYRF